MLYSVILIVHLLGFPPNQRFIFNTFETERQCHDVVEVMEKRYPGVSLTCEIET